MYMYCVRRELYMNKHELFYLQKQKNGPMTCPSFFLQWNYKVLSVLREDS